jgi:glycine C-acetyltransferase
MLSASTALRDKLEANARHFRAGLKSAGLNILPGEHPIVPVMLGDAKVAQEFSRRLLDRGVFAIGFFFPVVPQGKARIRTQVSAAHEQTHLDRAIEAFAAVGRELGATG